ncbi:hypothetical protein F4808DRAFT_470787 [Astrocystis sublimbata]|nr:hypothetical protein F4808DRAFT_470787 [Astrocystis sublimbata]
MSNTASTEPFQMRIPSPDPNLTGEILARQVPDDPTRTGSIYADEFLAKKCPQQFDELQRRQFFCILDLRRLKYAADEIFAKKDWKLNILNFAKEYEKSRSLIMLRYGLYEFKSVKPSNEVLKKWRAAHGLPSEPEEANGTSTQKARTPGPAGATKRKAAEELTPKTNPLMASTSNRNKRRNLAQEEAEDAVLNGPAPFKKSKRKADEGDEMDENKPSKQQKSTPSTATSLFASIINKPRDGGTSPSKPTSQSPSLFGLSKPKDSPSASFATKANPFQAADSSLLFGTPKLNNPSLSSGSVLADHKIGSAPATNTGNIFSYLSESSQNDDDDDHETDEEQEKDSEEQVPSGAISTNTSTPPLQNGSSLFGTSKPSSTANIFGALTKPADQVTKGGLFGRVQMGADGQPVRASPVPDEKQIDSANQTPATGTPAKKPGDYTFNPTTTPISFGTPALGTAKSTSKGEGEADKQNYKMSNIAIDSSFPAPSSMGTTPVNGTPEPQSPHPDGEEAPQEQIKLTDGGPGEEDEEILHEVRAKAIKYIVVQEDDEDDKDKKSKSPWSTMGVGPLRVLKNKSTGAVRVLLRGEPRGHVAINKTILSDMKYEATDKTVKLVAASDDGSSLETWLLQVKLPSFAAELAAVMEANKSANKK